MRPFQLLALVILVFATSCGDTSVSVDGNNGGNNGVNNGNNGVNNGNNGVNNGNNGVNNGNNTNNGGECIDYYADDDGDGFGADEEPQACVLPEDTPPADTTPASGDCGPGDPLRYPGSPGVCGDNVDDNCDGDDESCPTSQPANMDVPDWDCTGNPPTNVAAWARFPSGEGYFVDGGCFVFFEGRPGEFYVQRQLDRASDDPTCETRDGCTCPSLNGWPAYDRRLYAFTLAGDPSGCDDVWIRDHGGEDQPVSNACRKYLYQLHFYDLPYSYVTSSYEALQQRLRLFPKVEVACAEDSPHANLPYQSLLVADVQYNEDFAP